MTTSLAELAQIVGGKVHGDGNVAIRGAGILRDATAEEITLADNANLVKKIAASPAAAVVVPRDLLPEGKPLLIVDNVAEAFARIVMHFHPPRGRSYVGVSRAAQVSPSAVIGEGVNIHAGASIGDDVRIGCHTTIYSGAHIAAGCTIAEDVTIYPGVTLYENTIVGPRTIIHAGAVIGAFGFGYNLKDGRHQLSAQLGNVVIEADVEIGACTTIDRGTFGPTVIGEGTKVDNLVMIAHNCRIGKHNILCSQVGIAGSTTTGDYVMMGGQVGVRDHVRVGDRAVLAAKAGVINDVPDGEIYGGIPAGPAKIEKLRHAVYTKLPELRKQIKELQQAVEQLQAEAAGASPKRDAA